MEFENVHPRLGEANRTPGHFAADEVLHINSCHGSVYRFSDHLCERMQNETEKEILGSVVSTHLEAWLNIRMRHVVG